MVDKPTVLVVGAQGLMGTRTTEMMRSKGWSVIRAGRHPEDAADFRFVDLENSQTFSAAVEGVDLIFSTVSDQKFALEEYVLENGGKLVCSAAAPSSAAVELNKAFPDAQGTVVLNAGVSGIVQLIAKMLLTMKPSADAMRLAYLWECKGDSGGIGGKTKQRFYSTPTKHPTTRVNFGEPHGIYEIPIMTSFAFFSETTMQGRKQYLAAGYDDREANDLLLFMNEHELLGQMPEAFFRRPFVNKWVPGKPSREPMVATIDSFKNGAPLCAGRLHYQGDWYAAAVGNWLFSKALLNGQGLATSGIHETGDMFKSFDMFELELARHCITLEMADKSLAIGL